MEEFKYIIGENVKVINKDSFAFDEIGQVTEVTYNKKLKIYTYKVFLYSTGTFIRVQEDELISIC